MAVMTRSARKAAAAVSKVGVKETPPKNGSSLPSRLPKNVRCAYLVVILVTLATASPFPVPVSLQMLALASSIVYIGSYGSTTQEASEQAETMESTDVYMFPVVGSGVLLSLYLAFKFLDKFWIDIAVKVYFFSIGVAILGGKLTQLLGGILPSGVVASSSSQRTSFVLPHIPLLNPKPGANPGDKEVTNEAEASITITLLDVFGYAGSFCVAALYLQSHHWMTSNIFGIVFSIQGIEMIKLGSFSNGAILLSGLFFYDIFWVFGTDVMVTVAKNFDAPIKLLFPQMDKEGRPSLLGLGDIVIPGIFVALLLRYDLSRAVNKGKSVLDADVTFFKVNLLFYGIGLATTTWVMYTFQAAQPALLYLVPACLFSALATGLVQGEFKSLTSFQEEPAADHRADPPTKATKRD